jgi:hypothetical protein
MVEKLNSFQIVILQQLNLVFPSYTDISMFKSAWLTNNLADTEKTVESWEKELIDESYVSRRIIDPPYFTMFPKPHMITESHEVKIEQKGREYLLLLSAVKPVVMEEDQSSDYKRDIAIIDDHLVCLIGKWQGKTIIKSEDYNRLVEYTYYLIQNNSLPKNIIQIQPTPISDAFIRKTFHGLYKMYKKTASREVWVAFLHGVFQQFTCSISSTGPKFSQYLPNSNYEDDKNLIE